MIPVLPRLRQGDGLSMLSLPAGGHMFLTLCKSKLHRATVTQAELHYEGSITIDTELLAAAGILPFERVQVVDIAHGARERRGRAPRAGGRSDHRHQLRADGAR